ncbi:MAG: carboxypeptidase regulatory-like domain-containing protein, partial [Sciscionella sp.]
VWVNFSQKGQNLDVDIVLPKQGSISGRVSDADGNLVPGSVVTLHEGSFPNRTLVVNADVDGNFEFHNVFAGTVTLSARAPSLGGLGGKTTVVIQAEGEEVAGVTIFLEPTGKIQGRITNPSDGSPAASAQVQLLRGGWLFDSINADTDGKFEFNLLPMATYDVQALDPRTGRHGRRNGLQLTQNDQVVQGDFQLETRGAVDGHLYEPGSAVAIPGATVRLGSSGLVGFSTFSSTGVDGYFEFLGIPQGRFDLFSREPGGRRVANGHGEIVTEGQRVSLDLFLERQGTVTGSVLNPLGSPDGVFSNANTVLQQDGQNIGATLDSNYSFNGVIVGHPFWLETQEIGGPHRGETWGNLSDVGPVQLDVRIHPVGSTVVNVRDSFGNPVNAATVEVDNDGFYGFKRFTGDTGIDNSITFQGLGEGRVTAYATNPATGLRGSANGLLTHEGEIVVINLALENSAQITGTVVTADGTTPAPNALVALQIAGRTLTTFTNDAGFFTLPSVPMGSFLLVFQESFGPGMREIRGTLSSNGQILDLGTVVLDAVNPK